MLAIPALVLAVATPRLASDGRGGRVRPAQGMLKETPATILLGLGAWL